MLVYQRVNRKSTIFFLNGQGRHATHHHPSQDLLQKRSLTLKARLAVLSTGMPLELEHPTKVVGWMDASIMGWHTCGMNTVVFRWFRTGITIV